MNTLWLFQNWDTILTIINAIGLLLVGKHATKGK